jgi:prepilin-type N-terminal cleavage/methylation domain-containing protein
MRGFTFIELVVTVTLILLMSSLVIAAYNGFNSAQAVVQGAQTLKANLVRIRTQAMSGDIPLTNIPSDCPELVGYQVEFPTATTYSAVAVCMVDGAREEVGTKVTYTLPKTVQFSAPLPAPLIFYVLDRGASREAVITLTGITKTVNIWVSSTGVVSDYLVPTPTHAP